MAVETPSSTNAATVNTNTGSQRTTRRTEAQGLARLEARTPSLSAAPRSAAQLPSRATQARSGAIKPSEYRPYDVSVKELAVPRERLRFGNDLQGESIDCTPRKAFQAEVRAPSSQGSKTGVFYQVDAQTFVRARDRALQAQGDRGRDVLQRSAADFERMGAKLYLNGSGGGGIATTKPTPDGRVEAISGFNLPKTAGQQESLDVTRRGVMKIDNVNVAECMQGLADDRLKLYGYKSVATLPITERLPDGWPQDRLGEQIHSLVIIPNHLLGSSALDSPAAQCTSQEEFYEAGRQAYERMYKAAS
jgi:hypothetical protein